MFVTNNHALFDLWLKEYLLNHQKVSKYYESSLLIIYEQTTEFRALST